MAVLGEGVVSYERGTPVSHLGSHPGETRYHSRARALREFIDYKISMITDEDPLRGLFFSQDLGFSHALHVLA